MKIEIYDTTLRDGAQGAGIDFTDDNRISIIHALDDLGVTYIEAGNIASASDAAFFAHCDEVKLKNSQLVVFCSTRHAKKSVEDDAGLAAIAKSPVKNVAIFGKCWEYQVTTVLGTTAEENYKMIRESIEYLKRAGKRVFFDAEHFFDGFSDSPDFAISVLETALDAGADYLVLCDTNGGMMPQAIGVAVSTVKKRLPSAKISIHCHNDLGMAVAGSAEAVLSGAVQVQCTMCGIGERCGNCNLTTILPLLQLKLGYSCITPEQLKMLTKTARYIMESANLSFDEHEPFVGGYAFTHKAGMHIDGVHKKPRTFEHISPELVGNADNLLISSMAGRSAYRAALSRIAPELNIVGDDEKLSAVIARIKEYEAKGFQFESAEASMYLIMLEALGMNRHSFDLLTFRVMISEPLSINPNSKTSALIKVSIPNGDGETVEEITAGEGDGPVNALDVALRRALSGFYPKLSGMRLSDFKVRVLDSSNTTASSVRVYIESTDGVSLWRTVGVSVDIVDASWQALRDSIDYYLLKGVNL
ncbi:MAG: citramalate synthase [Firmicutes bacterium]|nr:citramalate synthase [Bacillota bacterium]